MRPNPDKLGVSVFFQTWNNRITIIDKQKLEFSYRYSDKPIKDVSITNHENNMPLSYKGFELSYVYDFTLWQGQFIFATGNGLYISEPYSNEIHCLMSAPDLLFFSLCPLNDCLYIGTSDGLYCVEAGHFLDIVAKAK